jgi:hypothetical protein
MFILKDLLADPVKGRYYKEQLRKAPTPGVDFNFEVKMDFLIYLNIGCLDSCTEESQFIAKCLIFCIILVSLQISLRVLRVL